MTLKERLIRLETYIREPTAFVEATMGQAERLCTDSLTEHVFVNACTMTLAGDPNGLVQLTWQQYSEYGNCMANVLCWC